MTKKKGYKLTIIFGAFLFFIYIMSTIPFGSDDWAWGTSVGMKGLRRILQDITDGISEIC